MKKSISVLLWAVLVLLSCRSYSQTQGVEKAKEVAPFCTCFIGYDMPLANQKKDSLSGLQGFYYEIAEEMAKRINRPLSPYYVLHAFYGRPIRKGLLENHCEAQFGLPRLNGDWYIPKKVALTQALTSIGFAIVAPKGMKITSLEDLKGKTVAVQIGSPPYIALSQQGGSHFLFQTDAEPAMKAFAEGKSDVAFIWGPVAGYLNKYRYNNAYQVIATEYTWEVAVAVTAENQELKTKLNQLISDMQGFIKEEEVKYGFPTGSLIPIPEEAKRPNK